MISAGNDIVSFAETDPVRTIQPAFYKKILTDWEVIQYQKLESNIVAFDAYVWLLWSVKEAAFKFLRRQNAKMVFSPTKFIIGDIKSVETMGLKSLDSDKVEDANTKSSWQGRITFHNTELTFFSAIGDGYVHSVVHQVHYSGQSYSAVEQIADSSAQNQSSEVRELCLDNLRRLKPAARFSIIKSEQGVPSIYNIEENLTYPVSFSHHGHFVACAFVI